MNKKFVYQVGNNKKLYCDARPTKCQDFNFGYIKKIRKKYISSFTK